MSTRAELEQELQHLRLLRVSGRSQTLFWPSMDSTSPFQLSVAVLVQQALSNWLFFLSCQVMQI